MKSGSNSPIILLLSKVIAPYIMLFGLYVVFHGHYSPGGGFQGGALLAAAVLLIRITFNEEVYQRHFRERLGIPLAALGVLIFAGLGGISLLLGGAFLDYSFLPIPGLEPETLRFFGILGIELGVGLAVMTILVSIYDTLLGAEDD
jgi:multicomponent Na+:H+ antiporter subunit B